MVTVAVGRGLSPDVRSCASLAGELDGCAELDGGNVLFWEEQQPEEDPGVVYLVARREGDVAVLTFLSGPSVTGDPRELDLAIGVDELADLVADPRIDLRTTADVVRAGESLSSWAGAS